MDKETIFCLTETWIKPNDPPLTVHGFMTYTSPFLTRPGKSGYLPRSCLIVSDALIVERPPICETLERSCCTLNVVCCFVVCKAVKMAVASVYRSPSTNVKAGLDELQLIITDLALHANHLIIAGDFNIDLLATSGICVTYTNLLSDLHLVQHVSQPSRITPISSILIDHSITSPNLTVNSMSQTVGLSDHLIQVLDISSISLVKPEKSVMYVRSLRRCDWNAVRSGIASPSGMGGHTHPHFTPCNYLA